MFHLFFIFMLFYLLCLYIHIFIYFCYILLLYLGYGDMAMSNCIGSNIFDILVCLGLPWLMVTITKDVGTGVTIHDDMTYTSLSLLASAVVILTLTYLNHWKLDRKLGVLFVVLYVTVTAVNSYYDVKHAVPPC